jgi:hypothetical protein|tara:strand:+ start:507 stop:701 length:195 start_codon:yes stop_codon:yes gene_type:complete
MADAYTEQAIYNYFKTQTEMECDKVYDTGAHEIVIFINEQEVIECLNNACDYNIYMPIETTNIN